ncbi:MAG: hypothetical protein MUF04_13830 [Akkermansiaceae bacterium]|jgi:hypothetical protein|nr:hypothetical protein [Akkermansiaceae bacterium]
MIARLLCFLGALALAFPVAADEPPHDGQATVAGEGVGLAQAGGVTPAETSAGAGAAAPATPVRPAPHRSAVRGLAKEPEERGIKQRVAAVVAEARPYWMQVLGVLGALLVAGALMYWRRQVAVHRLPEFAIEPRLGGSHGAGIGGVISFADPSQPPSSQRRLRPDSYSLP